MIDPFADEQLKAWLDLDDISGAALADALQAMTSAAAGACRDRGLNQRQAAFLCTTMLGSIISAQATIEDRDSLINIARRVLDRVPESWEKAQARFGRREGVH